MSSTEKTFNSGLGFVLKAVWMQVLEENVHAAHVHLNALKIVVESRGGFRDFPSGIRDIIHWWEFAMFSRWDFY